MSIAKTTGTVADGFVGFWKMLSCGIGVLNTLLKLVQTYKFFSNTFVDFFSSFYDFKIQEKELIN